MALQARSFGSSADSFARKSWYPVNGRGVLVGSVEVDFQAVIERARGIAPSFKQSLENRFADSKNPLLIRGHARLTGKTNDVFNVQVGAQNIQARQIILDTGTRSLIPDVSGLAEIPYIHAGNWLEQTTLPSHIAIIGGGYIATEIGQFYRRVGSRVTSSALVGDDERLITIHKEAIEADWNIYLDWGSTLVALLRPPYKNRHSQRLIAHVAS